MRSKRKSGFPILIALTILASSCRSSQPRLTSLDAYQRLVPELFPIDVRGTGIGFRHWVAMLPGQTLPEVAFVIERPMTPAPEQKFGPVTATYIEAAGKPLITQLDELPRGLSIDQMRSAIHVTKHEFTEETCPGITGILDQLEHQAFYVEWRDAVWHPVRIDAVIKTSAAAYSMTCYGSPCLGLGDWSMRAPVLLNDCVRASVAKP